MTGIKVKNWCSITRNYFSKSSRTVVRNLFWMATPFLAIYFWWHIIITKCLNVCVLKWQLSVFFYKMKSLECLATHFDVTCDTQMCRDALFENHWSRSYENFTIHPYKVLWIWTLGPDSQNFLRQILKIYVTLGLNFLRFFSKQI